MKTVQIVFFSEENFLERMSNFMREEDPLKVIVDGNDNQDEYDSFCKVLCDKICDREGVLTVEYWHELTELFFGKELPFPFDIGNPLVLSHWKDAEFLIRLS